MRKNIIIAALAVAGIAVSTTVAAGLLSSVATAGWTTKATKNYKLEMYGFDARAYEFNTDNGMSCVAVFPGGDVTGWQLACQPVKK